MKMHKIEIAKRQLEAASEIYFSDGDYLAVITLAGAAEEILGAFLRRNKEPAMIDHLVELDKKHFGGRAFAVINNEVNGVRNALKHANNENEDEIEVEQGEAIAMLGRAVVNYVLLTKSSTPVITRVINHLVELHPSVGL